MLFKTQKNLGIVLLLIISPYFSIAQIAFQEVGQEKNILHQIERGSVGGGVSIYDFNQDGLDDLTLATERGRKLGFYLNTGDSFEALPALVNNVEEAKQILWADYDNDGDADLFVAGYWGHNRLYRNEGDLNLVEITAESGLPVEIQEAYGACWGDYNRDGWLDLLCNYRTYKDSLRGGNRLYENNADGTFTEITKEAEMGNDYRLPFMSTFLDYNNDKWPDIYTANDKLTFNTLYENSGKGTFYDISEETGANARMNAMCVNAADMNNDGWTDIYVTNTPVGSKCLMNSGPKESIYDITFENKAVEKGITYLGGTGWGSNFFDADNDGDLDLYVSGNGIDPIIKGIHFYENIEHDHFEIITEGFEKDTTRSFSNAIGDFNNDGLLDIIVQNNPPHNFYLWENQTDNTNHWVKLKLEGVLSNRDAIGVRIESYAGDLYQSKYTHCGFGFLGQNTNYQHIGLNQHTQLDSLILTWPTGHQDKFYQLNTNQLYSIQEGETTNGNIHIDDKVYIKNRPMSTAIEKVEETATLLLSPNPVRNELFLQSDFPLSQVEILGLDGKVLDVILLKNQESIRLTVDDYRSGLYLLKVMNSEGEFRTKKWVKL